MASSQHVSSRPQSQLKTFILAFAGWKAFLLSVALGTSISASYDTSTSLALGLPPNYEASALSLTDALAERLTRWDAIYFTSIAKRGYLFEQEWAFGAGLPLVVSQLSRLSSRGLGLGTTSGASSPPEDRPDGGPLGYAPDARAAALLSIFVANTCHFLAVFLLYKLTKVLFPERRIALVTALLHVFSPAGLFLSAPYAESLFACLSFAGYLLYARGCYAANGLARGAHQVVAGGLLGLATACRNNGILGGLIFAVEALVGVWGLWKNPQTGKVLSLVPVILGGMLVGMGTLVPQAVAYRRYCSEASGREWCQNRVPSIYAFVQERYWNTGLFHYWTLPNLPLFLLAAPVLSLLLLSANDCLRSVTRKLAQFSRLGNTTPDQRVWLMLLSLALGQLALAVLALTSYHVQIITRLASGYPVWYFWLAEVLVDGERTGAVLGGRVVRFMVLYAAVQGVLFASFLPPA